MRAVVFAGPSLDSSEGRQRLDADFLSPVRRGDIDAVLARDEIPQVIGIIDGAFLQSFAVSPKEVLRAIDRGVVVLGSSSIGALRAVECGPYGMIGVGRIYEEYRSGRIEADDEVAMVYDPATNRPLSEPLINMRFSVAAALDAGCVTPSVADRFLRIGKGLYFPDRTAARILRALASEVGDVPCQGLARFLRESAPDTKHDDAIALLARMKEQLPAR